MRYRFILISFIGFFVSCGPSVHHETSGDTSTFVSKDTAQLPREDSFRKDDIRTITIRDSTGMISVLVGNSLIVFKQADTTSEILQELSFHNQCLVPIEDILNMKPIVRCMHDSIVGYARRKDLFITVPSSSPQKKYLVWLASEDSVQLIRINTEKHWIEDQLSIKNTGVYIRARLLNADSWLETSAVIEVEMDPAACESTCSANVIDYKDRLKFLITTCSYGDEDGSFYSKLLFKKDLLLHVVTTDEWQGVENNGRRQQKIETAKFRWNGDTLVSVSIKK
ncbi:MAG TPA: hypothetical protein VK796_05800 [Cytophaga sp.]|jgi:hypothetical protein|nr:hypothetical protein [Cytophaga sp.]